MTPDEFNVPEPTSMQEAMEQRNRFLAYAKLYYANTQHYRELLYRMTPLLGDAIRINEAGQVAPEGDVFYDQIPDAVEHLVRVLKTSHDSAQSVFERLYKLLGVESDADYSARQKLGRVLIECQHKGFNTSSETDISFILYQLCETETLLETVLGKSNKDIDTLVEKPLPGKVRLRINVRSVNGVLQLGYMRDVDGQQHNLETTQGDLVFFIVVDVDEKYLKPNIAEVKGTIKHR